MSLLQSNATLEDRPLATLQGYFPPLHATDLSFATLFDSWYNSTRRVSVEESFTFGFIKATVGLMNYRNPGSPWIACI